MHNIIKTNQSKALFAHHANKILKGGEQNTISVVTPFTAFTLAKEENEILYIFYTLKEDGTLEYRSVGYEEITVKNLEDALTRIDGSFGVNLVDQFVVGSNPFSNFTCLPYNYSEIFGIIRLINSYILGVGIKDCKRKSVETRQFVNFLPACDNSVMDVTINPVDKILTIGITFSVQGIECRTNNPIDVNYDEITFIPALFTAFKNLADNYSTYYAKVDKERRERKQQQQTKESEEV